MPYFFLIVVWLLGTGLAWRRIFSQRYSWFVGTVCLFFTLVPIVGPVFYLMIDPPESSVITITPEEFWQPTKGAGRPWPSYGPLMRSLRAVFKRSAEESE